MATGLLWWTGPHVFSMHLSAQPGEQQKDCDIPGISKSLYRKRDWEVCGTIISAGRLWSCPVVLARQKPVNNYRKKTHTDSKKSLRCSVGGVEAVGAVWVHECVCKVKTGWASCSWDYLTYITITPFSTTARRLDRHRKIQGNLLESELCF